MISWFRYIPYADILWRLAQGWQPCADLGHHHGQWSVLCVWTGEGEPP